MSTRCIPAVTGPFAGLRNPDGEAVGESGSGLVAGTPGRLMTMRRARLEALQQ